MVSSLRPQHLELHIAKTDLWFTRDSSPFHRVLPEVFPGGQLEHIGGSKAPLSDPEIESYFFVFSV